MYLSVVRPPADPNKPARLIVLWHGFGVPNSEEMLAEVLPLENVQAWKAYLGLPLFGKRLPNGGLEEIMRRQLSAERSATVASCYRTSDAGIT
ncbi:hypothetical protein NIES4071_65010 [Calothrix sp. NIES-4071]|nr:hypothetical protein NIES4071_65010 [Calothrix sp. NIES-4071]BAZ60805.1 hypothetical protein NIES4105_64970 [Calothrix sp. NIES-4105]